MSRPAIVALLLTQIVFTTRAAFFETTVPPGPNDKYVSAEYRLWIPDGFRRVQGIIVKQHGCGDSAATNGLNHANDLQWQALAKKHDCALLGTRFWTRQGPCSNWSDPANGSGAAFLTALDQLASASRHSEVRDAPWVLWGHSGGAFWSTAMLAKYSERVVAVIAVRGGELTNVGPKVISVPVLWAVGGKDNVGHSAADEVSVQMKSKHKATNCFNRYRPQGAPWTLAVEAHAGHETGDTRFLAIPYLDTLLPKRLTKPGRSLRPIGTSPGSTVSWLPDLRVMLRFVQYSNLGLILPRDDPDDPKDFRLTASGDGAVISWTYEPDLYDGCPSFRIERNGQVIHTVGAPRHNYGDAPLTLDGRFEFRDTNAMRGATYAVIAFNQLGEETVTKRLK